MQGMGTNIIIVQTERFYSGRCFAVIHHTIWIPFSSTPSQFRFVSCLFSSLLFGIRYDSTITEELDRCHFAQLVSDCAICFYEWKSIEDEFRLMV